MSQLECVPLPDDPSGCGSRRYSRVDRECEMVMDRAWVKDRLVNVLLRLPLRLSRPLARIIGVIWPGFRSA